jgi:hypothetical protein
MLRDPTIFLPFTMCILFHWDSSLCNVSSSSRTPTPRGSNIEGDPRADGAQGGAWDHGPRDSSGEVAHSDGALIPDTTVVVGTMAFEAVAGDRSLAPELVAATAPMAGKVVVGSHAAPISSSIDVSSL